MDLEQAMSVDSGGQCQLPTFTLRRTLKFGQVNYPLPRQLGQQTSNVILYVPLRQLQHRSYYTWTNRRRLQELNEEAVEL